MPTSRDTDVEPAPTRRRAHHRLRLLRPAGDRGLRRLCGQLPPREGARGRRGHRRRRGPRHAHARAGRAGADAALQHPGRLRPPAWHRGRAPGGRPVKRHLLVTNDFPPKVGGIQNYLWELWRRLDPASYVVLTASSHAGAAAFDAEQAARGRAHRAGARAHPLLPDTRRARRPCARCVARARGRPGPARSRPAARPPRPAPRPALRRHPPRRRGDGARPPARSRAALARVLRGAAVCPAGGYPAAEAATPPPGSRRRWSRSRPGSTPRPSRPLKAAERRAARARLGLPATARSSSA